MKVKDVTSLVEFGDNDGESLPLTKCVCGAKFLVWDGPIISIYPNWAYECPKCKHKFYFTNEIHVYEILEGLDAPL